VIVWWLARHAEPSLADDATASHMAGLLCSHNTDLEQQVAERFLRMQHDARRTPYVVRLILSPMDSGRLAVGIIRTAN
jgi:hypothetical protein